MAEVLIATGKFDDAYARLKPLIVRGRPTVYLARTVAKLAKKAGREAEAIQIVQEKRCARRQYACRLRSTARGFIPSFRKA